MCFAYLIMFLCRFYMNYLYFGQMMQFFDGEIYRYGDIMKKMLWSATDRITAPHATSHMEVLHHEKSFGK